MGLEKDRFLNRDRLRTALSEDGNWRALLLVADQSCEEARSRHDPDPLAAQALAESAVCTLLATANLKGEERVQFRTSSDGYIRHIYTEAIATGEVRGYIRSEPAELSGDDRRSLLAAALPEARLEVDLILEGSAEPYRTILPVPAGSLPQALADYFVMSDQTAAVARVDVRLTEDFRIGSARGLLLLSLPGADQDMLPAMREALDSVDLAHVDFRDRDLGDILGHGPGQIAFREIGKKTVDFFCRCSKDRFLSHMQLLPEGDLREMAYEKEPQILTCHYCNNRYEISPAEIRNLLLLN